MVSERQMDIVKRLRQDADAWETVSHTAVGPHTADLQREAADEIERLMRKNEKLKRKLRELGHDEC
jgi:hypothetical protein